MVAFSAANDLPSNINTVERLYAWSGRVLVALAPQQLITEIAGASPELVVSSNPFPVLADPNDYHTRLIQRASLRLAANWDSQRLWLAVQEISTTAIPAAYRQV